MRDMEELFLAKLEEPSLVVESESHFGVTPISNVFIADFAGRLPGDAVKVYLGLAAMISQPAVGLRKTAHESVLDTLCRTLRMERREAIQALKALDALGLAMARPRYLRDSSAPHEWRWERDDLYMLEVVPAISLETDSHKLAALAQAQLSEGAVGGLSAGSAQAAASADSEEAEAIELQSLINANFRVAQEVLVTIGNREMRQCELWLRKYGYGPDMVKALLEYCVGRGKKDIGYATVVAREWHKTGVRTIDDLEVYLAKYEETKGKYARIRKMMGRHDGLTEAEKDLYDRWTGEWGFGEELLSLACKAATKARTPSFDYVNSVLESWHGAGAHTTEAAQAHMERTKPQTRPDGFRGPRRQPTGGRGTAARSPGNANYYGEFAKMEEALLDSAEEEANPKG